LSLKGLTSGSQPGGFEDIEFLPLGKLAGFLKDFIQDAGAQSLLSKANNTN